MTPPPAAKAIEPILAEMVTYPVVRGIRQSAAGTASPGAVDHLDAHQYIPIVFSPILLR